MKTTTPRRPAAKKGPSFAFDLGAALGAAGRGAFAIAGSPAFGRTLLAGLVCAGFSAASWRARAHVIDQPRQQIDRRELANISLPPFLSDGARADLAGLPLPEKVSAFHPGLVVTLASELGKIPWVESVESLSLGFDGETEDAKLLPRVRFALKVARPIARIDERGREVLVARSRRRIPQDRVVPAARALPRIEGLGDDIEREKALDDALALVQALEKGSLGARLGVTTIQLSGKDATLVLASGVRVDFGPTASVSSLSVEARLSQLELFLAKGVGLDQVERLSVRWDDPVYVLKPVAAVATAK